ncbi:MAG TPA: SRPBCC family protein [Nocardioides sp.]|nr:SRPBCC family protein [Nocardioides sp.]
MTTPLPASAYTSPAVLAWELRHLYAARWVCLGRIDDLLAGGVTQRGVLVGDVGAVLVRHGDEGGVRLFANTCRHRGHELVPVGGTSTGRAVVCPYHGWAYDTAGCLVAAPGFDDSLGERPLAELPVRTWQGWVFGHGLSDPPDFDAHLGDLAGLVAPYAPETLVRAASHVYEISANWKLVAENYHECYHCPQIHPELCAVSPPTSGDNYDLPGDWVGGRMDLRDGAATMSLTGESGGRPIATAPARTVEYLHLLPDLLISAHPDYVMTHRLRPVAPDRTEVECSWHLPPADDGSVPDPAWAVDFWDLTNRQDWAACESVQRGLANPHYEPGPYAADEDAVARFVGLIRAAYDGGGCPL